MQRLLELQRCLSDSSPSIIIPGRILKREGILNKVSSKKGHSEKLYTVLMSDIIMFNKIKKPAPKLSLKCDLILPLNKCRIVELLDKGSFRIICQKVEIVLFNEQLSETKLWISNIHNAIDSLLNDRKTLKKESSSRRPVKRKDVHEYHEAGLSPGRPLKKRKFFTLEENSESTTERKSDFKLSHRKSIHSINQNLFETNASSFSHQSTTDTNTTENVVDIYGQTNNNNTSLINNIFGGVGSTIKRIFGFRNN